MKIWLSLGVLISVVIIAYSVTDDSQLGLLLGIAGVIANGGLLIAEFKKK